MLLSSLIDPGASTLKSIKKVATVGTALLIVSRNITQNIPFKLSHSLLLVPQVNT